MSIIVNYIDKVKYYIYRGNERSVRAKKNILASFGLKGINIALGFITFPLAIKYLGPVQFGIFATLTSIIEWFNLSDIGLGQGLRNKFTEAVADKDDKLARIYVSTTHYILGIIIFSILIIFLVVNHFLNWSEILNASNSLYRELKILAVIVFSAFSLRFVFSPIYRVLYALQKPALVDVCQTIGKIIWFISLIILVNTSKRSILYFGSVQSLILALVPISASIYYYGFKYKKYSPSIKYIEIKNSKRLITLGIQFFIIQVSFIVTQMTSNILIIQLIGPASVTSYNVAFKYFIYIHMAFNIISIPLWSAYTEAYIKKDFIWIKNIIKKMIRLWIFLLIIVIIMVLVSNLFFRFWIGDTVKVTFLVTALVGLLILTKSWISIFHYLINGVGKIKLQMYLTIVSGIIHIPLAIFLVKFFKMGSAGIVLGSVLSLIVSSIIAPIQTKKILENKAIGIWNK